MGKNFYTEADIHTMRDSARECKMNAPALFWLGEVAQLTTICNGFGADSQPAAVRNALTKIYADYSEVAAIHDCRYYESDGTENNRSDADDEFLNNALKKWRARWGFWRYFRPKALAEKALIDLAYEVLCNHGAAAWQEAYEERIERGEVVEYGD